MLSRSEFAPTNEFCRQKQKPTASVKTEDANLNWREEQDFQMRRLDQGLGGRNDLARKQINELREREKVYRLCGRSL